MMSLRMSVNETSERGGSMITIVAFNAAPPSLLLPWLGLGVMYDLDRTLVKQETSSLSYSLHSNDMC